MSALVGGRSRRNGPACMPDSPIPKIPKKALQVVDLQGLIKWAILEMGDTGLEPVTPSLSSALGSIRKALNGKPFNDLHYRNSCRVRRQEAPFAVFPLHFSAQSAIACNRHNTPAGKTNSCVWHFCSPHGPPQRFERGLEPPAGCGDSVSRFSVRADRQSINTAAQS